MRTNLILSLVLASFLVSLVSSGTYTVTAYGQYPVCSSVPGVIGYTDPLQVAASISEKKSFYYNGGALDNVEIMARVKPGDALKFELITIDRDLVSTTKEITRAVAPAVETIHSLLGPVLITKTINAGIVSFSAYYYHQSGSLIGSNIPLAAFGSTPWTNIDLKLVAYDDNTGTVLDIYAFWEDGVTAKGVYKNSIAFRTTMAAAGTQTAATAVGTLLFPFPRIAATYGGRNLIIGTGDGKCYKSDGTTFIGDATCNIVNVPGSTWSSFNLHQFTTVVVSTKAGAAGNIQYSYSAAITTGKLQLAASAAAYRTFTDELFCFFFKNVCIADVCENKFWPILFIEPNSEQKPMKFMLDSRLGFKSGLAGFLLLTEKNFSQIKQINSFIQSEFVIS